MISCSLSTVFKDLYPIFTFQIGSAYFEKLYCKGDDFLEKKAEGVFISYKMTHNSDKSVKLLCSLFKENDVYCYAAGLDKESGISIRQTIMNEIKKCSHLLVLINEDLINNDNRWIIKEISWAECLGKRIVPIIFTKHYPVKDLLNTLLIDNDLKALLVSEDLNDFINSFNSTFGTSLTPNVFKTITDEVASKSNIDVGYFESVKNRIKNETMQSKEIQFTSNVIGNSTNELVTLGIVVGIIILVAWLLSHNN